jgi:hypothetical protein
MLLQVNLRGCIRFSIHGKPTSWGITPALQTSQLQICWLIDSRWGLIGTGTRFLLLIAIPSFRIATLKATFSEGHASSHRLVGAPDLHSQCRVRKGVRGKRDGKPSWLLYNAVVSPLQLSSLQPSVQSPRSSHSFTHTHRSSFSHPSLR